MSWLDTVLRLDKCGNKAEQCGPAGGGVDYPYACQLPLVPLILGNNWKVEPSLIWKFGSRVLCRDKLKCISLCILHCLRQDILCPICQFLIQGSIHQGPRLLLSYSTLDSLQIWSSCGCSFMLFQSAEPDVALWIQAVEVDCGGLRSLLFRDALPGAAALDYIAFKVLRSSQQHCSD